MIWRTLAPAALSETARPTDGDTGIGRPDAASRAVKQDHADIDIPNRTDTDRSTTQSVSSVLGKPVETVTYPASPSLAVGKAMLSEPSWRPVPVAEATHLQTHRVPLSPRTLEVQLNPEHLGAVNATLRMSGTQLKVELRVSTRDAHDRLKGEEQVIEKAIRSLGYEGAQISIIQSSVAVTASPRADAAMQSMAQHRDQPPGGMASGEGGGRSGNQQGGRHDDSGTDALGGAAQRDTDRAGGGVYI
jgi:flagellar hook-length control protein FliK